MAKLNEDIDALFKLPLVEFVGARKVLAARLRKNGYASEAEHVRALGKPSISAWTVNQLYWKHREAFDELIATGQRFRKAQTSGNMANMREALDARREALSHLSDLAAVVLRDAGSNSSLDTLRRIATTLEALSASPSFSKGATPGRLTQDIDPPGFDSFGSFTPMTATTKPRARPSHVGTSKKAVTTSGNKQQKSRTAADVSRREDRQARINAAKESLKESRKSLSATQAAVRSLEGAQKKSEAMVKEAARQKREAEERFKSAIAAATDANLRAQSVGLELTKATKGLDEAKRAVEKATQELEAAFRQSDG